MTATRRLEVAAGVETTEVGDRRVLYHGETGEALVLNPSGSLLWDRLAQAPAERDDLIETLMERHGDVDRGRAGRDTDAFLAQLRELRLLG